MSELKPCPFCGGTKICTEKGINLNYCDNCSAESNVEHWNTRPIEDALNARIAELENLLMEVRTRVEKAEARKKRFICQLTDRAEKAETIAERLANEGSVISYKLEEYSKDDALYSNWDDAFSDWKRTYEPDEASNA